MNKDLTVGNPSTVLWKFCLPMFGSVVFQQLYNIADSLVAGKFVGEAALAAVGNSYEITLIFIAFAFGCNIGCSVIVSRFFGARQYEDMKTAVTTSLIGCAVLTALLMAVGLTGCDALLRLINTPAEIMAENLKRIYPIPALVRAEATTTIGEVRKVRAPAVFLELGYHDNPDDAAWVKSQLDLIAQNLVGSLCQYFGIPFLTPVPERRGVVDVSWGYLNIRDKPDTRSAVIARAYDGARLTILNQWQGWYLVRFGDVTGYASGDYITLV